MTAKIIDNIFAQGYKGMLSDPNLKTAKAWGCVRMVQMNDPVSMSDQQIIDYYHSNPYNTTPGIACIDQESSAEFDWNPNDSPPRAYPGTASTYKGLDAQVVRLKKLLPGVKILVYSFAPCGSDYGRLAYGNGTQMDTNYQGANAIPEAVQLRADVDAFGMEEYEWKGLDNSASNFANWISICTNSAKIARKLNPDKPLCGFIYGRQGDDQSVYVPASQFTTMLQTMFPLFDYIIVWYTSANAIGSQDVWYPALCDYMNNNAPGTGNGNLIAGDGGVTPPPNPGTHDCTLSLSVKGSAPQQFALCSGIAAAPAGFTVQPQAFGAIYKTAGAGRQAINRVKSSDGRYAMSCASDTPGPGWAQDILLGYADIATAAGLTQMVKARTATPLYLWYGEGALPAGYSSLGPVAGVYIAGQVAPPVDQSKAIALLHQSNAAIVGSVPAASTDIASAVTALGG